MISDPRRKQSKRRMIAAVARSGIPCDLLSHGGSGEWSVANIVKIYIDFQGFSWLAM